MWQAGGWRILGLTVPETLMVFYGNACMQSEESRLHFCRAGLSFLIALSHKLSLESFLPLGRVLWDTCSPQRLSSVWFVCITSGHAKRSWTSTHLSEDQSLLMPEAHLWVKAFVSLLSLPSLSVSWMLLSSTLAKKLPVGQSQSENAETSLGGEAPAQQCHFCTTEGEGAMGHCWLQKWAELLQQWGTVWKGRGL